MKGVLNFEMRLYFFVQKEYYFEMKDLLWELSPTILTVVFFTTKIQYAFSNQLFEYLKRTLKERQYYKTSSAKIDLLQIWRVHLSFEITVITCYF